MNIIEPKSWKADMPALREKAEAFQRGEVKKGEYKGFSGRYGTYAQHDQTKNMLRLRMTAGRATKEKLAYVADAIRRYDVDKVHFTTCQTIQLHDLSVGDMCDIMEGALDVGIVTMGGGGDFPRNTMCSPLSGVQKGEYFDVLPYAEASAQYAMNLINAEKMPRKLKCCFSNGPENVPHATFRDLGFVATPEGRFDVYSAGGLGNNPKLGVKVAEGIEPERILYYLKAMWLTFRAYGNYENRGKARTRYMQEACGGADAYRKAYLEKLDEVLASGEDLTVHVEPYTVTKTGDGSTACGPRVIEQKQPGLYAVVWHPLGGDPKPADLCALSDAIADMPEVEVRISPDECVYVINLTGTEAQRVLEVTKDSAESLFETTVACVGVSICQVGVRDSQALLKACVKAVREAGLPDGALPQMNITGCPSSCAAPQTSPIGFRGALKNRMPAFVLTVDGCSRQGEEAMGKELGTILESEIPELLVKVGRAVAESGMDYAAWRSANPGVLEEIAAPYIA